MENTEKIITALQGAGKPLKAGEIAELVGIDKKQVDKVIKAQTAAGKIVSPKRCFYEVKK